MEFWRLETRASFALSEQGLVEAAEMGNVLATRAKTLSKNPAKEDVLILAHGPGDDAENERWLKQLDARAEVVRKSLPFHAVQVATLREDWPDKRVEAEKRIRAFVERSAKEGRRGRDPAAGGAARRDRDVRGAGRGRSAAPDRFMYVWGFTSRMRCTPRRPSATSESPSFRHGSKCQTSARWSTNHQPTL